MKRKSSTIVTQGVVAKVTQQLKYTTKHCCVLPEVRSISTFLHTLSLHAPLHPVRFHISTTTFCNYRSLFALLFSLEFQTDIQHYCIRMHVCIMSKKSPATKLTTLWKFIIIHSYWNRLELIQYTYVFVKYSFFAIDILYGCD